MRLSKVTVSHTNENLKTVILYIDYGKINIEYVLNIQVKKHVKAVAGRNSIEFYSYMWKIRNTEEKYI